MVKTRGIAIKQTIISCQSIAQNISTATFNNTSFLVHLSDELVNVAFPVTEITTLDIVLKLACPPSTSRVRELEWPKKVRCLQANNDTVEHSF